MNRDTEILQEKYYLDVDTLSSTILELIKETEVQKFFSFFLSLFGGKLLYNVMANYGMKKLNVCFVVIIASA